MKPRKPPGLRRGGGRGGGGWNRLSVETKKLRGTFKASRERARLAAAPAHRVSIGTCPVPSPPPDCDDAYRDAWLSHAEDVDSLGIFARSDRKAFAAMIDSLVVARRCAGGEKITSTWGAASARYSGYLVKFGLDPGARERLGITTPAPATAAAQGRAPLRPMPFIVLHPPEPETH